MRPRRAALARPARSARVPIGTSMNGAATIGVERAKDPRPPEPDDAHHRLVVRSGSGRRGAGRAERGGHERTKSEHRAVEPRCGGLLHGRPTLAARPRPWKVCEGPPRQSRVPNGVVMPSIEPMSVSWS